MGDSAQDRAMFQRWITSPAAGYCRRNPDGSRYEWPVEPAAPESLPALTDAEREAIELTIMHLENGGRQPLAATLRGLLKRAETVRE